MEGSVTLPIWIFALLVLTAVLLTLDRILLPGFRWYLRRRVNRDNKFFFLLLPLLLTGNYRCRTEISRV